MKSELTGKQQKFAEGVVEGLNLSDAYRAAYNCGKMSDKTINNKASELMGKGEITGRVAELRKPITDKLQVTVESLTSELDEAITMSRKQEDPNALRAAVMSKAKIHGLDVSKVEHTGADGGPIDVVATILKIESDIGELFDEPS